MNKRSRRHGLMELRTYASGDGSVSLVWEGADGKALAEPVTESDASEYLDKYEEAFKWEGWEIVSVSREGGTSVKLARAVKRPAGSHKKLVMGGKVYEYSQKDGALGKYMAGNTTFVCVGEEVASLDVMASLLFFLNHELDYRASGLETREQI